MVAVMKGTGDQCEVDENYYIYCNNTVDIRKTVIVDILDIGDDSNVDDELDASHGYDDGIDDNTVKGDEGDEDDDADDDIDFNALMM